jgi:hypothetical protein
MDGQSEPSGCHPSLSRVASDIPTPPSQHAPSLWHLYINGWRELNVKGHKDDMNHWFDCGSFRGLNSLHSRDLDLYGPIVDLVEEWDFFRQLKQKIHLSNVAALDRSKKPRVEYLAQCFVASVGLHNHEVMEGYLTAVKTHRTLTDRSADAEHRTANHGVITHPWDKWQGITLTTIDAERLDMDGNPIDNDTPSYPLGSYPILDDFRAKLPELLEAEQQRRKEELSSRRGRKKAKTGAEVTSDWDGDHRGSGGTDTSSRNDAAELGTSTSQTSLPATRDCSPEAVQRLLGIINQLQAEQASLRTQSTSGMMPSSSVVHSTVSASSAGAPSRLRPVVPLASPDNSTVSSTNTPIQSTASCQTSGAADSSVLIRIPATIPPPNRLLPPGRAPSASTTVMTLPIHYNSEYHSGTTMSGQGSRTADMLPTDSVHMMLLAQQQQYERLLEAEAKAAEAARVSALKAQSAMAHIQCQAHDLKKDQLLLTINNERATNGWMPIPHLPKDLSGDHLGEREFPDLSYPQTRHPFTRTNGPLGHLPSSHSLRSSNPHIPSFYYQTPYAQPLSSHPAPHFSHFPHH